MTALAVLLRATGAVTMPRPRRRLAPATRRALLEYAAAAALVLAAMAIAGWMDAPCLSG